MQERTGSAGRLVAELARQHWSTLYRMAYNVLGEPAAAELTTQEGLLESWRLFSKSPNGCTLDVGRLLGYAARTVKARALEAARRRRRLATSESGRSAIGLGAAPSPARKPALQGGLARLAPDVELVLLLHLFEGCSLREVAALLDIKLATATARYHQAIRKLEAGDEDEAAA